MNSKHKMIFSFFILSLSSHIVLADTLIPAVKSGFYYKIGGGQDIPMPAFYDTSYIPLDVDANIGLGYDCGAFNPIASITNSLNQIKQSFIAVQSQVLADATAAVTEFPLYELSRADPNLYNLITNAMTGAHEDLAISTKSCEVMQSEIGAGEDPYAHWGQISLGNKWKQEIGSAIASGDGDINEAKQNVGKDAGKSGVPWFNPSSPNLSGGDGSYNAGGVNQAPIQVIHDIAMGGYNIIVHDSTNNSSQSTGNELQTVWPDAKTAADWITRMVGDQTITTYDGGNKSSIPGNDIYADIETQTTALLPALQSLVTGATPLSLNNLQALSTQGMALSPDMIKSIQMQPKIMQAILTQKLAQNLAAMNAIDKVRLAIHVLQTGAQIPAAYSNNAAQTHVHEAITRLQQSVQNMLMFVKARDSLMSNTFASIIDAGDAAMTQNTNIAVPGKQEPIIDNGAIKSSS